MVRARTFGRMVVSTLESTPTTRNTYLKDMDCRAMACTLGLMEGDTRGNGRMASNMAKPNTTSLMVRLSAASGITVSESSG